MIENMGTGVVVTYNVGGGAYHAGTRVDGAACAGPCVMMRPAHSCALCSLHLTHQHHIYC